MFSLLAPVGLFLIFLMPPFLMVVAIARLQKRMGWTRKTHGMAAATTSVFIAAVTNSIIVATNLPEIYAAQINFTWPIIVGLLISWCSIWVRLMVPLLHKRRRRSAR